MKVGDFSFVIFDDAAAYTFGLAHNIKDRGSNTAKASFALRSMYRWCLSGTPCMFCSRNIPQSGPR